MMNVVGMSASGVKKWASLRFGEAPETQSGEVKESEASATKGATEKATDAPPPQTAEVKSFASQVQGLAQTMWQGALSTLKHLLNWTGKQLLWLAAALKIAPPAPEGIAAAPAQKKAPTQPNPANTATHQAARTMGDTDDVFVLHVVKNFGKLKANNKLPQPDFLLQNAADHVIEIQKQNVIPKPIFLAGHLADQKDLLKLLARDIQTKNNVFQMVVENYGDETFNQHWEDVVTRAAGTLSYDDPMDTPPISSLLEGALEEMHSQVGSTEKGVFYLVGNQNIQPILPLLPDLARKYPRLQIIVAGMEELPANLPSDTVFRSHVMKLEPPQLQDAIFEFNELGKFDPLGPAPRVLLQQRHNVSIPPETIVATIHKLKELNGRYPDPQRVLSYLEQAITHLPPAPVAPADPEQQLVEAPSPPAPLVLGVEHVKEFATWYQENIQLHSSKTVTNNNGFFRISGKSDTRLDQVIGQEEAVQELRNLSALLKNYSVIDNLRNHTPSDGSPKRKIELPKLVVLKGPPGTGKTMCVRALANESNVKLFSLNANDLIAKYLGEGAERVREVFHQAYAQKPSIIFVDEIDALARARQSGGSGADNEVQNILMQLLTEIDGMETRDGVTTVVATNRPQDLDAALGDRQYASILFKKPTEAAREKILGVHTQGKPMAPDVDLKAIAQQSKGFSGRTLKRLLERCNNRVLVESEPIVTKYASQTTPDYDAMGKELPAITQTILLEELAKVKQKKATRRNGFALGEIHKERQRIAAG